MSAVIVALKSFVLCRYETYFQKLEDAVLDLPKLEDDLEEMNKNLNTEELQWTFKVCFVKSVGVAIGVCAEYSGFDLIL